MKDIREPKKEIYKFSNALHRLGLNPRTISRKGSLLFGHKDRISISDSPIHWAEVTYWFDRGDGPVPSEWAYLVKYGVPDPRVRVGLHAGF